MPNTKTKFQNIFALFKEIPSFLANSVVSVGTMHPIYRSTVVSRWAACVCVCVCVSFEWVLTVMSLNNILSDVASNRVSDFKLGKFGLTRGNCLQHGTCIVSALDDSGSDVPFGVLSLGSGRIAIGPMLGDPNDVLFGDSSN